MEELPIRSSTHVRHVQFSATTFEMRIALAEPGADARWYAYKRVPARHFDALREQERGALAQPAGYPKGEKPYSVGTYYNTYIKGGFDERRVEGPLLNPFARW